MYSVGAAARRGQPFGIAEKGAKSLKMRATAAGRGAAGMRGA
jgi:hypothetical protein